MRLLLIGCGSTIFVLSGLIFAASWGHPLDMFLALVAAIVGITLFAKGTDE